MGRHKEWRKLAKKVRRKRIRQQSAAERDEKEEIERKRRESSPTYIKMCVEQEILKQFREEEELRLARQLEKEWLKKEEEAQKQWHELQIRLEQIKEEKAKEEERLILEWKREQEKIHKEKERRRKLKEENERKVEIVKTKIEEYISNGGNMPEELNISMETNPNKPLCPFFQKTGACRFKDICSRNHIRPGISKTLLFPSFYSHFSLNQSRENEYGNDLELEYEEKETYNHFREFFYDVVPEFEKCGYVKQFQVCKNKEPHLRGNVYVEYASTRNALKAFKTFQARWYGGKQLSVEFCNILSWKTAICGLSYGSKCPKGSSCNFLHVFINPDKKFSNSGRDLTYECDLENHNRHWSWSESPERFIDNKENHKNRRRSRHYDKRRYRKRKSRSSSRSRSKSRSKSPFRRRKKKKRSRKI